MKKINNIFTLLVMALMGLSLAACSNDDLDTNQYQGGVSLNAFGPSPVMRGGQLRFIGSNLDQIREVRIPGVDAITTIEVVKAGVPSEIRVTVPHDGPEVGNVVLVANNDQEITTKSTLTYTEGIVIKSITPSAMPGDVIEIKGDEDGYLNLIHSMAFADNVLVSEKDFLQHDRYTIKVKVPEDAKTGKLQFYTADLTVGDAAKLDYQIVLSDDRLIVGTPTVAKVKGRNEVDAEGTITAKAGETVTVTGDYMQLIKAVKVGGVEITEFTIAEDGKSLSFVLPAEAPDGAIDLVCKSDVEVPAAMVETVKPSDCVAAPAPVKAGAALTISGKDMDLVTAVEFDNADALSGEAISVAADKVVVTAVPETATEGKLRLVMANGQKVEVDFTLVKPTATGYNANPASAGSTIQITGTDLDLVKSVDFGGAEANVEKDDVSADGTTLNVKVPMAAKSGAPVLKLANGVTINAPELTIKEAVFCYVTELPGEDAELHAGQTFVLPIANGDKLTGVEIAGKVCQFIVSGNTLTVGAPDNAKKGTSVRLISSNGEITYKIDFIPNSEITTVIWTGAFAAGNWAQGFQTLAWGGYDWSKVTPGTELVVTFGVDPAVGYCQMRFANGNWAALPGTTELEGSDKDGNIAMSNDAKEYRLVLTQAMIDKLTENGLVICGAGFILTKVALVEHISLEVDLAGQVKTNSGKDITYPFSFQWAADGQINLTKDFLLGLGVKKGSKLIIYKDPTAKGQVQINNSSWSAIYTIADWTPSLEVLEQEFDDAMMAGLNGGGFWIQGDLGGVKKICILP
ncbi:MAG: hypothetical protein SO375_06300 [Prevotella sp.]|nr:hypothetical protein [Prevotella sp.]MDY4683924.1 hypothetical protein [Prevotella sp.]